MTLAAQSPGSRMDRSSAQGTRWKPNRYRIGHQPLASVMFEHNTGREVVVSMDDVTIDPDDWRAFAHWARHFGISQSRLMAIVDGVGGTAANVRGEIRRIRAIGGM